MLKNLMLAAALSCICALPAFADEENFAPHCVAPMPPPTIDGARASEADLTAGKTAVEDFVLASDKYQRCLRKYLGGQQDMAQFAKTNVPTSVVKGVETRIAANQRLKEQVGQGYNDAVLAYKTKSGTP